MTGMLAGLHDPALFAKLESAEKKLRDEMEQRAGSDPQCKAALAAYEKIKASRRRSRKTRRSTITTKPSGLASRFIGSRAVFPANFSICPFLVASRRNETSRTASACPPTRMARALLELDLLSSKPIYNDFEILLLTDSLTDLATHFGADDPLVQKVLAGKSPGARAAELVDGTKLKDLGFRKKMWNADSATIEAANDPMLALALLIDPTARAARKIFDANEESKQQAYAEIAKARFALHGTSTYPDATFTLRLSYGTVRGYEENGKPVAPFTDLAGLYARSAEHANREPFDLPARWVERKGQLSLGTKFDFVCDADIIGGNSGSPVVNQAGQFVGIIFDGNIQSLVWDYIYDNQVARAVSVDSAAIIEALRKVYDAGPLADELLGR